MTNQLMTRDIHRNRAGIDMTVLDRGILEAAFTGVQTWKAGDTLVHRGEPTHFSTLLMRGLISRNIDGVDGNRQLVAVHVPGDFVDLHSFALKTLDHDVSALSDVTVAMIPHSALEHILDTQSKLTRRLWSLTLQDAAIHRQWVSRSALTSLGRIAHFFCEMNARLLAVSEADSHGFKLPMTQAEIGGACNMTNVHVSRVLRQMREAGLCFVRESRVEVLDLKRLVAAGAFNIDYLYLNRATAQLALGQGLES